MCSCAFHLGQICSTVLGQVDNGRKHGNAAHLKNIKLKGAEQYNRTPNNTIKTKELLTEPEVCTVKYRTEVF